MMTAKLVTVRKIKTENKVRDRTTPSELETFQNIQTKQWALKDSVVPVEYSLITSDDPTVI